MDAKGFAWIQITNIKNLKQKQTRRRRACSTIRKTTLTTLKTKKLKKRKGQGCRKGNGKTKGTTLVGRKNKTTAAGVAATGKPRRTMKPTPSTAVLSPPRIRIPLVLETWERTYLRDHWSELVANAAQKKTPGLVFAGSSTENFNHQLRIARKSFQAHDQKYSCESCDISSHTMRKSVATHLFRQGVPLHAVAAYVGHDDIESLRRYIFSGTHASRVSE